MMLNETLPAGIASLFYLHHESDEVASLSWPPKQPRTIDVEGLYREVRSFCAKGLTPEQRARADLLQKIQTLTVELWSADHGNRGLSCRGTNSSNPSPSSGE